MYLVESALLTSLVCSKEGSLASCLGTYYIRCEKLGCIYMYNVGADGDSRGKGTI